MKTIDKIKRLVVRRQFVFTFKAECELLSSSLTEDDIIESIVNAPDVKKVLRSKAKAGDKLYVIEAPNFTGLWIYTKGKIARNGKTFYVLISAKMSE